MNLLPCPFCGGEVRLGNYRFARDRELVDMWWVACTQCGVDTHADTFTPELAAAAWNRRAVTTLDRGSLLIVRKALQRYRMRIEEVGAMGWYDNPEVTRQEVARVDAILAQLEQQGAGEA